MSRAVLQDDTGHFGPGAEQVEEENGRENAATRCCSGGGGSEGGCVETMGGGGGGDGHVCRVAASVGSSTPKSNSCNTRPRMRSPDACVRGASNDSRRHGSRDGDSLGGAGSPRTRIPGQRLVNGRESARRNGCGSEAYCSSPEGRVAVAESLTRSVGGCSRGGGGGGEETGPTILTVLRETAAAGGGMGIRAGVRRDRDRSRERQQQRP